jgi:flagellar hook-length control protein FliK
MPVVAVEETTVQQAVQPEVTATIVTSIEPEIVTPTVVTEQQPTEVLPEQEQDVPADNTQQSPVEVELTTPVENESTPVAATPQSAQTESQPQSEAPVEQQDKQDSEVTVTDAAAAEAQPLFRTIEPHMVKVSETGTTEQTTETQPPEQQIASRLNDAIEQGDSRVEIQLEPQSLGKVTVELTQHSDGSLHIVLNADNARTHTLLQQHTEGLQQLLGGQDRKPVEIEVQHQERSQDAPNYDGRHGHSQQQQEQQERRPSRQQSSEDFLQQLRLGLVPLEAS